MTKKTWACPLDKYWAKLLGISEASSLLAKAAERQREELAKTLNFVYTKSSFYRLKLDSHNLAPKNREELAKLPFTLASDLENFAAFLCCSKDAIERMVTLKTSGTTGAPKRLAFSLKDLEQTKAFFKWGLAMFIEVGPKIAVLLPGGDRPLGVVDLLAKALKDQDCQVFWPKAELLKPENLKFLSEWLSDLAPNLLIASPSQLQALLNFLPQGVPNLTRVLASAELLNPDLKEKIINSWQCELLNHYGLTETGFGGAVECQNHSGMHIRPLDLIFEVISLEDQRVLPFGEVGEIVVTTLRREAMPLIRYRTGDVGSIIEGPCSCGSPFPRLGPILGRVEFRSTCGYTLVNRPKGG